MSAGRHDAEGAASVPTRAEKVESEEEEEDYMSEAMLQQMEAAAARGGRSSGSATTTYSERRRKELAQSSAKGRVKSRAEREREAREEGLARSLLEGGADRNSKDKNGGSNSSGAPPQSKALKMMLGMGFNPGDSLGKRKAAADEEERSKPAASSAAAEPIAIDQRWQGRVRSGIGSLDVSRAIHTAAAAQAASKSKGAGGADAAAIDDFRARVAAEQALKHSEALLSRARKTCEELDRARLQMRYSPLWIDPHWLELHWADQLNDNQRAILQDAFGAELDDALGVSAGGREGDALPSLARQESKLRHALASDANKKADSEAEAEEANPPPPEGTVSKSDGGPETEGSPAPAQWSPATEAREFCSLDAPTRLSITLAHLRQAHHYCLFCGCAYDNAEDLAAQCPGETEDDHD